MIVNADSYAYLDTMEANSVDTVITDPPYGLKFMGKKWDYDIPRKDFWEKVLRVCKPGAIILVFGGTRTYHRLAVEIEDVGFEIRDTIMWLYGQGFPKSHNISKGIDKHLGAEREVIGVKNTNPERFKQFKEQDGTERKTFNNDITKPASEQAQAWDGWGTALKPAFEPIIVAMKPLDGTYAENALKYGVAGLNIDGSRIGTELRDKRVKTANVTLSESSFSKYINGSYADGYTDQGRFPANIILDEDSAALLDEQSGELKVSGAAKSNKPVEQHNTKSIFTGIGNKNGTLHNDKGGASRFFYVAKASRSERDKGLENHLTWENAVLDLELMELNQHLKDISEDTMLLLKDIDLNMLLFGNNTTEQSQQDTKYIISMVLNLITTLKTYKSLQHLNIKEYIQDAIRTMMVDGLNLVDAVENIKMLKQNTTNEKMVLVLNVVSVVLDVLLKIKDKGRSGNIHSTVKPIKLLEYLCTLTKTPTNGIILDPFMGSGSLGIAALNTGREYIGIEIDEGYYKIAEKRIAAWKKE